MRAVALSADKNIEFLNENLINTWVSNLELKRTDVNKKYMPKRYPDDSKGYDTTHPLTQAIMKGWHQHSPVDCMVISPDFEVLGSISINNFVNVQFRNFGHDKAYRIFIKGALSGKQPGLDNNGRACSTTDWNAFFNSGIKVNALSVGLNSDNLSHHVLNIFRTPERGYQDFTIVEIDTSAFEDGGMLCIDIQVGSAEPAGSFYLFDADADIPTDGVPHNVLESIQDVPSRKMGIIRYRFDNGQQFKLGATGNGFSEKGSINAFQAKISVKEIE